jgi:hypothetical protein
LGFDHVRDATRDLRGLRLRARFDHDPNELLGA